MPAPTKFYGSQVGGRPITSHSYTGSPLKLLRHDIYLAFSLLFYFPYIVFPTNPLRSGHLCELYPSWQNFWSMFLHFILICLQLPFILSIPFWVVLPIGTAILGVTGFLLANKVLWWLLNGGKMEYWSKPEFASNEGHEHEQWIFLNGVAVGKHWLQSNIDRLALTFRRPILGVHNKTNGILFDVLQCLIQRNFNYATSDIRSCYSIVKDKLYDPSLTKVIFILHSQGGIEGGMILDWLLQEVPQDLMAKLEVYTFGCAANHFNNPHLHLLSQVVALKDPGRVALTKSVTSVHYHHPSPSPLSRVNGNGIGNGNGNLNGSISTRRSTNQQSTSGKTIRYIEHYAHTSDYVALWGVLHFTASSHPSTSSPTTPRYMGRVFSHSAQGHQLNMHYLDNMFPLEATADGKGGIGDSGFVGACEGEENAFMGSAMEFELGGSVGATGRNERENEGEGGCGDEREGVEISFLGTNGCTLNDNEDDEEEEEEGEVDGEEVLISESSPISPETMRRFELGMTSGIAVQNGNGNGNGNGNERMNRKGRKEKKKQEFKVKDLSRLWLYVNGKSPRVDETDLGIVRMATI